MDYLEDFLCSETFSLFLAEALIERLAFMNAKIIQKLTLKWADSDRNRRIIRVKSK